MDTVPASIGNLTNLTFLSLSVNSITGNIPASIGNLANLSYLDVSQNQLTGKIPATIGQLSSIETLNLYDNLLSDTIPGSISQLSLLQLLDLSRNQLSGRIPATIGNLQNLGNFFAFHNQLSDTLPASLGNLLKLSTLDLDHNQLTGSIPASLGNLTSLSDLELYSNNLTGSIPASLGNLYVPGRIWLDSNQLSGAIPASIVHAEDFLRLNRNYFTFDGMESVAQVNLLNIYAPQYPIPLHYRNHTLAVSAGGTLSNNTYSWYNKGTLVATISGDSTYAIPSFTATDSFYVTVSNSIATQLILVSDTLSPLGDTLVLADRPAIETANREFTDTAGWTNYYFDNNTPNNINDDLLLLSIKKNGQHIGTIGDGTFQVKLTATAAAGTNTAIELTNPLITNPSGYWVMNRYWQVTPTNEPTGDVGVRFYYNNQDLNDLNGSYPTHNLTNEQLIFYKTIGGNPDPTSNLAGASQLISIVPGLAPSNTTWTYHSISDSTQYAEFSVAGFSGGGGGGTGNGQPLPLTLVDFNGHPAENAVSLNWTTTDEKNMAYFIVEYSTDDNAFQAVGKVAAYDNSFGLNSYSFIHTSPDPGENFYRLRIVNIDNSFTYSKTIQVSLPGKTMSLLVYPNPVKAMVNLNLFNASLPKSVELDIVDMQGRVCRKIELQLQTAGTSASFDISDLAKGPYLLAIRGENVTPVLVIKE